MSLDRHTLSFEKGGGMESQNNEEEQMELNTECHTKHGLEVVFEEVAEENNGQNEERYDATVELKSLKLEKKDTFMLPSMRSIEERDSLESIEIDQQVQEDEEVEETDDSNQEANDGQVAKDGLKSFKLTSCGDVDDDSDNNQSSSPRIVPVRLPSLLSVTVAEPKKKGIQEPRPPRNGGYHSSTILKKEILSNVSTYNRGERKSRSKKFQFPDTELCEEEQAKESTPVSSSSSNGPVNRMTRRRFSATAAMTTMVPLRRKSFTLTKGTGPIKPLLPSIEERAIPPPLSSTSSRFHTRRQSTSACYPRTRRNSIRAPSTLLPFSFPTKPSTLSTSSQMIVRVRERKLDGVPEIVISKRFTRPTLVWHWQDRQIHLPSFGTIIPLGPHQHGVMLRQLRYVKSVMHEFPWAKTQLKEMLALYTKKEMSKEELYPQLNLLSTQVTDDRNTLMKKQVQLIQKKQKLTTQLSVATSILNELSLLKYGRRGKPHETKLYYDPGQPMTLHWIRKNGEMSQEILQVDQIQIQYYDSSFNTNNSLVKAMKKCPQTILSETCLSLITPLRTLDLQMKSLLHREWLVNALTDIISFAQQYKAAGVKHEQAEWSTTNVITIRSTSGSPHVLRRM